MQMPAALQAIGFNQALMDVAGLYWGERIKIARRQRGALLNMAAFVVLSLGTSTLSVAFPEGHWLLDLNKWLMWIAIGASVTWLAILEFAVYQWNEQLSDRPHSMNHVQRRTVIQLGNTVALGVLRFKRPPALDGN